MSRTITCRERDELVMGNHLPVYSGGHQPYPPYRRTTTWVLPNGDHLREAVYLNDDFSVNPDIPCEHEVGPPEEDE